MNSLPKENNIIIMVDKRINCILPTFIIKFVIFSLLSLSFIIFVTRARKSPFNALAYINIYPSIDEAIEKIVISVVFEVIANNVGIIEKNNLSAIIATEIHKE